MNWTQYLLSKLAEEATEVAKEALKCQQQGVDSLYNGKPAIMELRSEYIELIAVVHMLELRPDVDRALNFHHINPIVSCKDNQDEDYDDIVSSKRQRLCYYAMFAYDSGQLQLTQEEFNLVQRQAELHRRHTAAGSIEHIHFRSAQTGEKPVDPLAPVTASISSGSDVRGPLDEPKA